MSLRHLLLGAALTLLLPLAPPARAQAKAAQGSALPYTLKTDKLPNGLAVTRVQFPSKGLVAYYTVVRVGSRNEVEAGKTGFAHFFEHMMFRGTKKHPPGVREATISKLGFNDNAFTTDDVTVYTSFGPASGLERLVELEADRFANLEYAEPAFRTEALAVLGEYHKNAASPWLKMEEELNGTAFTKSTYRHTTMGFYADVKAMPEQYAYSRTFFERWYTPDNAHVFIVGEFDDAKLMEAVRAQYAQWTRKSRPVTVPVEPRQTQPRSVSVEWPATTQPRDVLAWHTPASRLDTTDAAVASILAAYLAGPTSPLYKGVVLDQQLAESVSADATDHRDPHLFSLVATLKAEENRGRVREAMDAAVRELAAGKVDAARVQAIQSNLRYGLLMGLESPADLALQLAWYTGIHGTPDALGRHIQNLARVQPQMLVAFARKHLVDTNRTVLTLTSKPAAAKETK